VRADDSPLVLGDRAALTLAEVVEEAARLTRVDRKYLVPVGVAQDLLDRLPSAYRVLSIGRRVTTTYRSTYFDTADLATARAHVQRRRRRWKARSRMYVEDGLCRTEVKARDGRGLTVKTVADSTPARYARLGEREAAFVCAALAGHGLAVDVARLRPTMEVGYRRTTLVCTSPEPSRLTVDWRLACRLDGRELRLDDGHVVVETKGAARPGSADRLLVGLGARPVPFSKYAAAASLLRDDIADNDVRALRGRLLHTSTVDERIGA
jgi:hypothetical protein